MTVSSDGNGSMPVFDADGRLVRLTIATETDLLRKFAGGRAPGPPAARDGRPALLDQRGATSTSSARKGRIGPGLRRRPDGARRRPRPRARSSPAEDG
ncbi:MAG: hypothetical protein MZV64_33665 [Ignavibacteriales bacterium]|nr:hypothetical protein [Ignavibacteriales bacterium]